jgi:hypothetical protein
MNELYWIVRIGSCFSAQKQEAMREVLTRVGSSTWYEQPMGVVLFNVS